MPVDTQHGIGFCHHQMQIVRNHQHRAVQFITQPGDQVIQRDLAVDIHTLSRLIQHQQLRPGEQGTGQQHTLHFTAGQPLHRFSGQMRGIDPLKRRETLALADTALQTQKTGHRQRHCRVEIEFLRNIADSQTRCAGDGAGRRFGKAEYHTDNSGFSRAVRPEKGDDFPGG